MLLRLYAYHDDDDGALKIAVDKMQHRQFPEDILIIHSVKHFT